MAKGASINFKSYRESVPQLLGLLKLDKEIKKYDKIVLKPFLRNAEQYASAEFTEEVLKFCIDNKNPVSEIFIAEAADGYNTMELFEALGYRALAEKYSVGLIDLNNTETEEIQDGLFLKFQSINYPKILSESFVITLPKLSLDSEFNFSGALSSMINSFPASHYKSFFSRTKNKIRKWPIRYTIHDAVRCKMPNFAVIDASEKGVILAGMPISLDKQAAKLLGMDAKTVPHLKTVIDNFESLDEAPVVTNSNNQ